MGRRFIVEEVDEPSYSLSFRTKIILAIGFVMSLLFWDAYVRDDITKHPEDLARLNELISQIQEMNPQDEVLRKQKDTLLRNLDNVRSGMDVDYSVGFGITALHGACCLAHYELVKWLVEHGADVNKKVDWNHSTPLMWVKGNSSDAAKIREYLKSKGAIESKAS